MRVRFISTGNIGNPLAGNLIRAGRRPTANGLREMGVQWAGRQPTVHGLREMGVQRAGRQPTVHGLRETGVQRAGRQPTVHGLREMGVQWAGRQPTVHGLREIGAQRAGRPNQAVLGNEVAFIFFPVPRDVGAVVLGEKGILESAADGTVYLDFSTNSPTVVRHHQQVCAEQGVTVVDAPVGGGKPPLLRVSLFVG